MPKIVDKQIKSQEIGRAALGVFRKYGYHHTTMADILKFTFDDNFNAFKREWKIRTYGSPTEQGD